MAGTDIPTAKEAVFATPRLGEAPGVRHLCGSTLCDDRRIDRSWSAAAVIYAAPDSTRVFDSPLTSELLLFEALLWV
jgi:hypothetical protein